MPTNSTRSSIVGGTTSATRENSSRVGQSERSARPDRLLWSSAFQSSEVRNGSAAPVHLATKRPFIDGPPSQHAEHSVSWVKRS